MKVERLIAQTIHHGAAIWCEGAEIRLRMPEAGISDSLRGMLRSAKADLLAYLADGRRYGPLSPAQRRLWLINVMNPGDAAYNMPLFLRMRGKLDLPLLQSSLDALLARHEPLRTVYRVFEEEPVQVVLRPEAFPLLVDNVMDVPAGEREADAERRIREEALIPFDIEQGPVCRGLVVQLGEDEWVLAITMHHIATDGWSLSVMTQEIAAHYNAQARGEEAPPLPELLPYLDYAVRQAAWLAGPDAERHLAYWKGKLTGAAPAEVPTDHPRPPHQTSAGAAVRVPLPKTLERQLRELAQQNGATLFMTLLAAFNVLLQRCTGQADLCVATPIANRTRRDEENVVGFFVNTLVMRLEVEPSASFAELVRQARQTALEAFEHQGMPFEELVAEINPARDPNRNPLAQIVFAVQNTPKRRLALPDLEVSREDWADSTTRFDMEFHVWERPEGMSSEILYSRELYDRAAIERLLRLWQRLLEAIVAAPDGRIQDLSLLDEDERRRVVREFNATQRPYPRDASIHALFEEQADQRPEAIAVEQEDRRLTYGELNGLANRIAHRLLEQGVQPGDVVGLSMERRMEMIAATLGILKTGAAYLPLDADYPAERLRDMMDDGGVKVVVMERSSAAELPAETARLCVDEAAEALAAAPAANPGVACGPEGVAYVMYTSGSTGKPKGVRVTHRNVVRLVCNPGYASFGPDDVFLQFAPTTFDASTFEIWGALLNGAKEVLAPAGHLSLAELGAVVQRHKVTTLFLTAGLFHQMVEDHLECLRGLRELYSGGDVLRPEHCRQVIEALPGIVMCNAYGPTEGGTYSTCHPMRRPEEVGATVSIGRPLGNSTCYVLDEQMQPMPVGVPGELYIGGDGVAAGYLNRPELTAERFVADPFVPGGRLYRTGDFARWREDGCLDFLGRRDNQVKVRGFRIELGEIEAALNMHEAVRESAVVAREDASGSKSLAAYVAGEGLESSGVLAFLRKRLPAYMIPQHMTVLDALPLNTHGKVDRKALPEPESPRSGEKTPLEGPVEEQLAEVWCGVLKVAGPGAEDDFFDAGGHSLLATQLVSRVRKCFGKEVSLRGFFEEPTIRGLARRLGDAGTGLDAIVRRAESSAPLSFAQQRLWFLDQLLPDNPFYNIPSSLRLRGQLDVHALESAIGEIAARHDTLRTCFVVDKGRPAQSIAPPSGFTLPIEDLSGLPEQVRELRASERAALEARTPFDLSQRPLFRAVLLRLNQEDHLLLLTIHHIIADGWSMGVMVQELATLYPAFCAGRPNPLPPLEVQYADFAVWQRDELGEEALKRQSAYWRGQLEGLRAAELPLDRPRPETLSYEGGLCETEIPPELLQALEKVSSNSGATLYMTLLAAFFVLLHRYTGEEDLAVASPIANRTRGETEGLIGFFVNTLVMRAGLGGNPVFTELLQEVRNYTLEAYDNQDLPFEQLVSELNPDRDLSRNPLVQIIFAVQNAPMDALELPGLYVEPQRLADPTTRFDIEFHVWERRGKLACQVMYCRELFARETIERLLRHWKHLLEAIAGNPAGRIQDYSLLDEDERRRVIETFNATQRAYPSGASVHALFEEQAAQRPGAVAVEQGATRLTYDELNRLANRIAHRLLSAGIKPGDLVGLSMKRRPEMVAATLGILKAGGAYLPLDADYPPERLRDMAADGGVGAVVTESALAKRLPSQLRVVIAEEEDGELAAASAENPGVVRGPQDLAYVMYTSGSTGTPKGVRVTHQNIVRLVRNTDYVTLGPDQVLFQFAPISFDAATFEIWGALLNGGKTALAPDGQLSLAELGEAMARHKVTTLFITSGVFHQMVDHHVEGFRGLREILSGGDVLQPDHCRRVMEALPQLTMCNIYGPTECTTFSTCNPMHGPEEVGARVSIGRPIANGTCYVLDEAMQPVAIGEPGELYIGGDGVAAGYLNRPELTAERFVEDPFVRGGRLYRTGDYVRWRGDGRIDFIGRRDNQVKVRGFRVELGEIEAALNAHPCVRESVVVAHEDASGSKSLAAYVVQSDALPKEEGDGQAVVAQWQDLYEETYREEQKEGSPLENFHGWNSSYTGEPIPIEEMREWAAATTARIRALNPRRVIEIGCGTGLLLGRIAPDCERYVGTDFSPAVLAHTQRLIGAMPELAHVELRQCAADELDSLEDGAFDTVILNSIVQYFPGMDYLARVLEGVSRILAPGGHVYVGDVRNYDLLEAYGASVAAYGAAPETTREALAGLTAQRVQREEELTISPRFFAAWRQAHAEVAGVWIEPKRGRAGNELTRFRYEAVLRLGGKPVPAAEPAWISWEDLAGGGLTALRERLTSASKPVGVRGIPNARHASTNRVLDWLGGKRAAENLGALEEQALSEGVEPDAVCALGAELGLAVQLDWTRSERGGFAAVFGAPAGAVAAPHVAQESNWRAYGNDPLKAAFARRFVPLLRDHLEARLPDFMTPQHFAVLDALPLNVNGKIDRAALPPIEFARPVSAEDYAAPQSAQETHMAAIWSELLGVERVGAKDDFFMLGGHSLLATQLVSRIRSDFGVEITLQQFFEAPTVQGLCALLPKDAAAAPAEDGLVSGAVSEEDELLDRLGELSEGELDELLAKLQRDRPD